MAGYNSYNSQYQGTMNTVPMNYNYQYPQFQSQQQVLPQPQEDGEVVWVQGEAGAKSTYVKPGKTKWLMDSEQPVFYIKSADISGMPLPLRTFDFVERTSKQTPSNFTQKPKKKESEYVKKDELEAMVSEILRKRVKARENKNE